MPMPTRKFLYFGVAFALTLPLDQITKKWIVARFAYGEQLVVIPGFFNLTHVRNPGGAFSFFANLPRRFVGNTPIGRSSGLSGRS